MVDLGVFSLYDKKKIQLLGFLEYFKVTLVILSDDFNIY